MGFDQTGTFHKFNGMKKTLLRDIAVSQAKQIYDLEADLNELLTRLDRYETALKQYADETHFKITSDVFETNIWYTDLGPQIAQEALKDK